MRERGERKGGSFSPACTCIWDLSRAATRYGIVLLLFIMYSNTRVIAAILASVIKMNFSA